MRNTFICGSLLICITKVVLAFSPDPNIYRFALWTVLPFGECVGVPVLSALVGQATGAMDRKFSYGIFYIVMNVAVLCTGPIIDFLRNNSSSSSSSSNSGGDVVSSSGVGVAAVSQLSWWEQVVSLSPNRKIALICACASFGAAAIAWMFMEDKLPEKETDDEAKKRGEKEVKENNDNNSNGAVKDDEARTTNVGAVRRKTTKLVGARIESKGKDGKEGEDLNANQQQDNKNNTSSSSDSELSNKARLFRFYCLVMLLVGVRVLFRHVDATFPKVCVCV